MIFNKNILVGICMTLFIFSCNPPEIILFSPTQDQSFITEAYINIHANITDNKGIKRVAYTIYNTPHTIYLDTLLPTTYELNETVSMSNLSGGSTVVEVSASDTDGNSTTESVTIRHTN